MSISEFYKACRNGDLHIVEQLLPTLTLEEINRIEPTVNSTSLHAACYYNRPQIVKLLLDHGASRTIRNKFGCTPFDEAQTEQAKELFRRPMDDALKRFSAEIPVDQTIEYTSVEYGKYGWVYKTYMNNENIDEAIDSVVNDERFEETVTTNKIENLLEDAREMQNPEPLVQIYSTSAGFCHVINNALGTDQLLQTKSKTHKDFHSFVGIFLHHDTLKKYRYVGRCYRGMKLSKEDFEKNYNTGQKLLIKPFISTSKCRDTAEKFASKRPLASKPLSILCIITIPERTLSYDDHVALDISSISEYPEEKEVLILPYTSLEIRKIHHLPCGLIEIEIEWYNSTEDPYRLTTIHEKFQDLTIN